MIGRVASAASVVLGAAAAGDVIEFRGAGVALRDVRVVHVGPVSVGYETAGGAADGAAPVHRVMLADVARIDFDAVDEASLDAAAARWAHVATARADRTSRPVVALLAVARLVDASGDAAWAAALPVPTPDGGPWGDVAARSAHREIAVRRRGRERGAADDATSDAGARGRRDGTEGPDARVLAVLRRLEARVARFVPIAAEDPARTGDSRRTTDDAGGAPRTAAGPDRGRTPADLRRQARMAEAAGDPGRAAARWLRLCVLHPAADEARGASDEAARLLAGPLADPAGAERVRRWAEAQGLAGSAATVGADQRSERDERTRREAGVRHAGGSDGRRSRPRGSG